MREKGAVGGAEGGGSFIGVKEKKKDLTRLFLQICEHIPLSTEHQRRPVPVLDASKSYCTEERHSRAVVSCLTPPSSLGLPQWSGGEVQYTIGLRGGKGRRTPTDELRQNTAGKLASIQAGEHEQGRGGNLPPAPFTNSSARPGAPTSTTDPLNPAAQ